MPTYEFECKCGHKFDLKLVKFEPPDTYPCPKCNLPAPKVISTTNFQFSQFLKDLCNDEMLNK